MSIKSINGSYNIFNNIFNPDEHVWMFPLILKRILSIGNKSQLVMVFGVVFVYFVFFLALMSLGISSEQGVFLVVFLCVHVLCFFKRNNNCYFQNMACCIKTTYH